MDSFPLPTTISVASADDGKKGTLTVEPLAPGYGTTLGNALRRVLLSALSGAAVTDVKIQGVDHEFSTVPHVKEDVVDILLNLKQLRFRAHTDQPVELHLSVKGKGQARAQDIESNAEMDVVNPEHVIATLTDDEAEFVMDLTVRKGRGYLPTELREKENRGIGTLAIDALFSPVRNVGFTVEPVRVGQMTNYDRLILTLETDGSVSPEEAFRGSARLLIAHFELVEKLGAPQPDHEAEQTATE